MKTDGPIFLNEQQVRHHLRIADLIPAMEKALIDFSEGKVTQPVRSVIKVDPPGGFLGLMPALTPDGLGLKAVTFYPSNAERGIPTHMATIFLVDPRTGTPLAIMDGRLITEMRTAAVSAAATKLLASPDSKILAILGSGVQARSHVEAMRLVRRVRRNSRVESDHRTRKALRQRNWCNRDLCRRSSARCGRCGHSNKLENASLKGIVAKARLPRERDWRVPPRLEGAG